MKRIFGLLLLLAGMLPTHEAFADAASVQAQINAIPWQNGMNAVGGPAVKNALTSIIGIFSGYASLSGATFTGDMSIKGRTTLSGGLAFASRTAVNAGDVTLQPSSDYALCVDKVATEPTIVYLPAGPALGSQYVVKDCKGDAATNNITVVPSGGDVTIDGLANYVLNTNLQSVSVLYDGQQWEALAGGGSSGGGVGTAFPVTTDATSAQPTTLNNVPYSISRNYVWNPSEGAWDQAQPFSGAGPTNVGPTNCSGTITAGGTAQNAFGAQTALHGFRIDNLSTDPMWISVVGSAAVGASGSILLAAGSTTVPGGSYSAPFGFGTNAAVSVIAATTADKFSCFWW